ncbi:MAG: LptF/LptG family permease, partial [Steroidobacteraceae bacterium]
DWYDRRLRGDPPNEALEIERVTSPDIHWGQGPKLANRALREIERHGVVVASAGLADTASHEGGDRWLFGNFRATRFMDGRTSVESAASRPLEVRVNPDFLGLAIVSPDALPVAGLLGYVRHLKQNRLDAQAFEIALWSRISRTVAVVLVCMLAVPFALGPRRATGAGARRGVGSLRGGLFFLRNRPRENSGQVFDLSPALAGWAPTLLLALVTWLALARASKA